MWRFNWSRPRMLKILNLSFWSWARSSSWEASHRGHPIEAAVLVPRSRQLRGGEREGCGERPVRGHVEDPAVSAVGWRHLGVEGCGCLTIQLVLKRVDCCICLLWHLWPSRYAEKGQEGPSGPSESLDRVHRSLQIWSPLLSHNFPGLSFNLN